MRLFGNQTDIEPAFFVQNDEYHIDYPTNTSNVGDVNNDGVDDYSILYSSTDAPRLEIFYGGDLTKTKADLVLKHPANFRLGPPVTGDFNGDGFQDIAINHYYDLNVGLYIYYGGSDIDAEPDYELLYKDVLEEVWHADIFYEYLSNAGDINMDGVDDLIFYSTSGEFTFPYNFTSFLLFGGTEIAKIPDLEITTPVGVRNFLSVSDINGDGKSEIAMASNNNIYFYSAFNESEGEIFIDEPIFVIEKDYFLQTETEDRVLGSFGAMMDTGDFNGDNLIDLAVSAITHENNFNSDPIDAVYLYFGFLENDSLKSTSFPLKSEYFLGYENQIENSYLSMHTGEITAIKDIDGDGSDEILIGSGQIFESQTNAVIYKGNASIDSIGLFPDIIFKSANKALNLGSLFMDKHSAIGDFDDDGTVDFIFTQGNDINYTTSPFYVYNLKKDPVGNEPEPTLKLEAFQLHQNYPNPFNPITQISYNLPASGDVKLEIFDITGRVISTIVNQKQIAGYYTVHFDASALASGVYIYRLQSSGFTQIKKMTLIK